MSNLTYPLILSLSDVVVLGYTKSLFDQNAPSSSYVLPSLAYATQIPLFKKALETNSLAVANVSWDVGSDVLVTLYSMLWLKEPIKTEHQYGLAFGLTALYLFSK